MADSETSEQSTRGRKLLLDTFGVAAGVFLALAADAAWDGHQERQLEGRYLQNLLVEMRAAQAEIQLDNDRRAFQLESLESLRAQFEARTVADSAIVAWVDVALNPSAAFFPPEAVIEDLVSSGNLQLIASDDLRFALMGYAQEKPRLRWVEEREQRFLADQLQPFLYDRISSVGGADAATVDSLLTSLAFQNLIREKISLVAGGLTWGERMRDSIERTIELLEADPRAAS